MKDGMGAWEERKCEHSGLREGESTSGCLCHYFLSPPCAPHRWLASPICFWLNGRWFGGPGESSYNTHHYQIYKQNYYKSDIQRPRHSSQLTHNLQVFEKSSYLKIFTLAVWDIVASSVDSAFILGRNLHFCLVKNILLLAKVTREIPNVLGLIT